MANENVTIDPATGLPVHPLWGTYQPKNVPLDEGLGPAAKQLWENITKGQGAVGLVSGAPQPAPPKQDVSTVFDEPHPGTASALEGNQDALDANRHVAEWETSLYGQPAKNTDTFIKGAGSDYSSLGLENGKKDFNEAYRTAPADYANAISEMADIKAKKADQVAAAYDKEAQRATAAAAQRMAADQRDQKELQYRQQGLELATQKVTADLQDQGKFWTNPGNIIAAISFALLPLGGAAPDAGVKAIQNAINDDLANRRAAAEGTLGALRSNLGAYERLVGNRQAADQLMEAEAKRVAAMEIERISQRFESPMAKAQGKALTAQFISQSDVARMNAFRQVYQPAAVASKSLHAARAQGFEGEYTPYNKGVPGANGPIATAANVKQPVGAGVTGVIGSGKSASPSLTSGEPAPRQMMALINTGVSDNRIKDIAMNQRVPDSAGNFATARALINRQATAMPGGQDPQKHDQNVRALMKDVYEELNKNKELLYKNSGNDALLGDVLHAAENIRAIEQFKGRDPEKFFGTMKAVMGPGAFQYFDRMKQTFQDRGVYPVEAQRMAEDQAVRQFRQKLGGIMNAYYHDIAGANQSDGELQRLKVAIDESGTFGDAYRWLQDRSKEMEGRRRALAQTMSPVAGLVFYASGPKVGARPGRSPLLGIPGPARAPEGQGEYTAPRSVGQAEPNMSVDPRVSR